jgi:hypothetical protein
MVSTELKIDGERLWGTIQDTAKWGAIPDSTGMCRLSCSDEDKAVREWFLEQTKELGCTNKVRETYGEVLICRLMRWETFSLFTPDKILRWRRLAWALIWILNLLVHSPESCADLKVDDTMVFLE